jgi:hypothetical protein
MFLLASFPRSGNTFFRIVLSEVYGIESIEYSVGKKLPAIDNLTPFAVKTHQLPSSLPRKYLELPVVYLVRDGRDALVSVAHQKKDLVDIGTTFEQNLIDSIIAPWGTHFGGWGRNVREWLDRADVIIKFEDLIENPIGCIEKLRDFIELPEPNKAKLPTFKDLKEKEYKYGSGSRKQLKNKNLTKEERRDKFFRRGKAGSWQDEMPEYLHSLFWMKNNDVMNMIGFYKPKGLEKISFHHDLFLTFKAYNSLAIKWVRRSFSRRF